MLIAFLIVVSVYCATMYLGQFGFLFVAMEDVGRLSTRDERYRPAKRRVVVTVLSLAVAPVAFPILLLGWARK